jgi:hypothetical protein
MGLPAILIVEIPGKGWHAITLTGYSLQQPQQRPQEVPGNSAIVPMVGLRIDRFYGHDDGIGPNARLIIHDSPTPNPVRTKCAVRFESAWEDTNGEHFIYPIAVTVPIYNKIRLTFLDVQTWITPLHALLASSMPDPRRIEWDVYLTLSNDYKTELKSDPILTPTVRENLLLTHHPRFWWRATMRYAGLTLVDLLFDATGIARSFPLSAIVWPVESFGAIIQQVLNDASLAPTFANIIRSERYLAFLRETLDRRDQPAKLLQRHLEF